MEIIVIIAVVSLAFLFIGRSWEHIFSNAGKTSGNTTCDGNCQECCNCGTPYKPAAREKTGINNTGHPEQSPNQ
jgi:hypothetical protein